MYKFEKSSIPELKLLQRHFMSDQIKTPSQMETKDEDPEHPETPELRPVEAFPAVVEGDRVICLRDPEGFAEEAIMFSEQATPILSQMDGTNTIEDIQQNLQQLTGGVPVPEETILEVVETLNSNFFLNSKRFHKEKDRQIDAFQSLVSREPACAGDTYPNGREECATFLKEMFERVDTRDPSKVTKKSNKISGCIAPHIDLQRGAKTYAKTYAPLQNAIPEDALFVILGTSHSPIQTPLLPTTKDYKTPLGTIPTAKRISEQLINQIPDDQFREDEIRHKSEHSIEFQTLFLSYLLKDNLSNARILPLLCKPFETSAQVQNPKDPETMLSEAREAGDQLKEIVDKSARPVFWIAGADLSHIGVRFGDEEETDEEKLDWLEQEDRDSLKFCEQMDESGFLKHVLRNDEQRKICGTAPMIHLMNLIDASKGDLIEYRQAANLEAETTVSFAGMYFYK